MEENHHHCSEALKRKKCANLGLNAKIVKKAVAAALFLASKSLRLAAILHLLRCSTYCLSSVVQIHYQDTRLSGTEVILIKIEFPDKNFYVSGFCQCVWTSVFQSRSRLSKNLEHAIRTRKADLFLALNNWVTHYAAPFSPSSKTR